MDDATSTLNDKIYHIQIDVLDINFPPGFNLDFVDSLFCELLDIDASFDTFGFCEDSTLSMDFLWFFVLL